MLCHARIQRGISKEVAQQIPFLHCQIIIKFLVNAICAIQMQLQQKQQRRATTTKSSTSI